MAEESTWKDLLGWDSEHLKEIRTIGYTYLKEGRYDLARSYFQALSVIDKESAFDRRMLGAIYLLQGDSLKALEVLQEALVLEPNNPIAKLNQAKAHFFLSQIPQGKEVAKELLQCKDPAISNDAEALLLAYS